ncbi:LysR family transcriptional regulator [Haliangium ochraceum]|uniref:Transcriptional regulator, LysR family n=1 Tax=Haliangium ochraceum (strain DSM 14365 / JCM 11303 / SMP-2) TaxID=502025 RepID=D0LFZ9_HALO1|nr:LysR family transcriptional regulator [Haliangium ochraceum]ACY14601.1 transcriptional regulator, LysR family [Haliangium ochraceum DSM 14365]
MGDLFSGVIPFVYAARHKSFRRAAEQIGVSPAAVSKAVQRLEDELGVVLLNRTTRRVRLSREGELYLARCEEAMAQMQAGRDLLAEAQRAPVGELSVSLPPVLGPLLVARLPRFTERYPDLRLHLRVSDRISRLVDDGVDVALRMGALDDSTLVARRVLSPRWVTLAAPAYLARHGTPGRPEDLAEHACIRFRAPWGREVAWSFRGERGAEPIALAAAGPIDIDSGPLLLDAAAAGLGICQVLDFMAAAQLESGRLVEILGAYASPGPAIHALCLPAQRSAPRVRALMDFLARLAAR